MAPQTLLSKGLDSLIKKVGTQARIRYFTSTIGSVWDSDVTLTQSGNDLWFSGIVLPVDKSQGSHDSILLEQGKLIDNSIKFFCNGSLLFTGSELQFKIGLGSPVKEEYTLVPEGTILAEVSDVPIYKKVYLNRLTTGSLVTG